MVGEKRRNPGLSYSLQQGYKYNQYYIQVRNSYLV